MPAILAIAYHSLVGSSGPVSSASSVDRLRRELGIDAGRAEEQQPVDARAVRRLDHVRFDHQVVVEKLGGMRVVGENAADLRRGDHDRVGPRARPSRPRPRPAASRSTSRRSTVSTSAALARQAPHDAAPTMPLWPATQIRRPRERKDLRHGSALGQRRIRRGLRHQLEIFAHHFVRRASSNADLMPPAELLARLAGDRRARRSTSVGRK